MMAAGDDVVGPINIGNPHEIPVSELAERIIAMTGSTSRIVYLPLPRDDPMQRCPDISRARALLGWEPTIGLEAGLRRTIAHFVALLGEQPVSCDGQGFGTSLQPQEFR
jgi:UDP-glucuronate decarboxylase